MDSRHLKISGAATLVSVAAALFVAAPAPAAIDVAPILAHSDEISSLARPEFGRAETAAALDDTAREAGTALADRAAEDAVDGREVETTERDCAKDALGDLGWDIWWAVSTGHSFDLGETAEHILENCLATYAPEGVDAVKVSREFASVITSDAESVYRAEEGDIYGVADWLLYADYWYVSE